MRNEMKRAVRINDWRNGDNGWVAEYQLDPPFQGNDTVIISAWRAIGGRFVTAVMDKENNFLSESFDGQRRHRDALASIGYKNGGDAETSTSLSSD